MAAVRNHVHEVAERMERELREEKVVFIGSFKRSRTSIVPSRKRHNNPSASVWEKPTKTGDIPKAITTTTRRAAPLIKLCVIESELNENISLPDPSRVRALRFGSYRI
jgi:hypothetical protein